MVETIDANKCIELIKEIKNNFSEEEIKKTLMNVKDSDYFDKTAKTFEVMNNLMKATGNTELLNKMFNYNKNLNKLDEFILYKMIIGGKELLNFVLELRNLENRNRELQERLNYFENKQANLDNIIQEKISQKLRDYQEKMEKLEKENRELKEQLGFYE